MTVTVVPAEFQFVVFDAGLIQRVTTDLVQALGIGRDVVIEVDETTPLARVSVAVDDPIVVRAESGAFEDTRRPRHQSENATAVTIGRMLLRARDRLASGFGDPPLDHDLSLAQVAAWDAFCAGRIERLGIATNQQRWRYNFRNRHGFTDAGDAAFDRIWASTGLTWSELDAISQAAAAAASPADASS